MAFLLQWIVSRTSTQDGQFTALYFNVLTRTLALNQLADDAQTCTRGNILQYILVKFRNIDNNLNILDGTAVIQSDEIHSLGTATSTDPSFYIYKFTIT